MARSTGIHERLISLVAASVYETQEKRTYKGNLNYEFQHKNAYDGQHKLMLTSLSKKTVSRLCVPVLRVCVLYVCAHALISGTCALFIFFIQIGNKI